MRRVTNAGTGARGTEAREHLLEVAGRLFAARGFSGTGLRKLAAEAGMSLSMVNYYFGTKRAVLEELLDAFYAAWLEAVRRALVPEATLEGKVRAFVRAVVAVARERPHQMRIAFAEYPQEVPELADLESARLAAIGQLLHEHLVPLLPPGRREALPLPMLAPAMATVVYSHFLVRPLLRHVMGAVPDDDAFFARYAEQVADLLLHGIAGPAGDAGGK